MSSLWNDRQLHYLRTHLTMTADRMAVAVSLLGPPRTTFGVASKRHELGLHNIMNDEPMQVRGRRSQEKQLGWPRLESPGSDEEARREQDRNYMRALVRDLQQRREAA